MGSQPSRLFPFIQAIPFIQPDARYGQLFYAAPNPLFAAQPMKVFRRGLFSKRPERGRLKFFAKLFFKKAEAEKTKQPEGHDIDGDD